MSDFRRLSIRGYRSIVKADLKLGRITIVIGPSDSGKSNLVRALRDWCYNCTSKTMVSKGKKVARIAVAIGHATKVVFERSLRGTTRGSARYVVRDGEDHEVSSYEKIGRTVPHEVTEITGVFPVELDDLSLRIQVAEQAEPWFLLSSPPWSPSKVSRVVGKISGLDALINANRDLVNRKVAYDREAKSCARTADDYEAELMRFETIDEQRRLVGEAEGLMDTIETNRQRLARASELVKSISVRKKSLKHVEAFLDAVDAPIARLSAIELGVKRSTYKEAERILEKIKSLTIKKNNAELKFKDAQNELEKLGRQLKKTAKSGELKCPLCGEYIHAACRAAIEEQAKFCGTAKSKGATKISRRKS